MEDWVVLRDLVVLIVVVELEFEVLVGDELGLIVIIEVINVVVIDVM